MKSPINFGPPSCMLYVLTTFLGFLGGTFFIVVYLSYKPHIIASVYKNIETTNYNSALNLESSSQKIYHRIDQNDNSDGQSAKKHVIMCMIFTTPQQWWSKALAVRTTWAKRCDFYKFFYSKNSEVKLDGAYALDVPEGREHLTMKTFAALRISYEFYRDHVDWYVKADDDAYIIIENLRTILARFNPAEPHYIGHKSTDFLSHGYNGGGASYSLSGAAAAAVVEKGDMFPHSCPSDGDFEDLDMGRCLEAFRIFPVDLSDEEGRLRFHPDHPIKLLQGDHSAQEVYSYVKGNVTFGRHNGIRVMSPSMVSFHYMDAAHIYMYDFLLYDLQRPMYNHDKC